jgi:hypothetical protein
MLTLLDSIDVHKLIGVRDLRLHRAHGLYTLTRVGAVIQMKVEDVGEPSTVLFPTMRHGEAHWPAVNG